MSKLEARPALIKGHDSARRRTVLSVLGAGVLLPESWKSPIVQSVILPAHAQTSPDTSSSPDTLSFADCTLILDLSEMSITTFICADGDVYQIAPTISGTVVGDDVSGIAVNIQTVMTADGSPVPEDIENLNGTVNTLGDGSYSLELDGFNGSEGPHILCTCEDGVTYEVTATVSSDDPRLPGQTTCSETFTCDDLPD